jgi:hypothetical protein
VHDSHEPIKPGVRNPPQSHPTHSTSHQLNSPTHAPGPPSHTHCPPGPRQTGSGSAARTAPSWRPPPSGCPFPRPAITTNSGGVVFVCLYAGGGCCWACGGGRGRVCAIWWSRLGRRSVDPMQQPASPFQTPQHTQTHPVPNRHEGEGRVCRHRRRRRHQWGPQQHEEQQGGQQCCAGGGTWLLLLPLPPPPPLLLLMRHHHQLLRLSDRVGSSEIRSNGMEIDAALLSLGSASLLCV